MRLVNRCGIKALVVVGLETIESFVGLELIPGFAIGIPKGKVDIGLGTRFPSLKVAFTRGKTTRNIRVGLES